MKTLVKCKIVLEDNGKGLVIYFWKKTFLWFGYWYPFGSSSCYPNQPKEKIWDINATNVSNVLFNNFLKGAGRKDIKLTKEELEKLRKEVIQDAINNM